jgi:pyridoxamine 5'-phosphate oxidase
MPIERFNEALRRATKSEPVVPNAATLATADEAGRPSARVVLIKDADERGFCFFTNYESRKGRELAVNPHAALCVHWKTLGEQVRIEGAVSRVSAEESDAYFATRPLQSQLGAIASHQSETLASLEELAQRLDVLKQQSDGPPPRPDQWGGYRLSPQRIEFWYHRDHRLHERVMYERERPEKDAVWQVSLLYP